MWKRIQDQKEQLLRGAHEGTAPGKNTRKLDPMESLFCSCQELRYYTAESGNHWCDMCSGLIPEERIEADKRMCKCEKVLGVYLDADAYTEVKRCATCRKEVDPSRDIRTAYDILDQLEDKGIPGAKRTVGPVALICKHCGHLNWTKHGNVGKTVRNLKEQKRFTCDSCRQVNLLPSTGLDLLK